MRLISKTKSTYFVTIDIRQLEIFSISSERQSGNCSNSIWNVAYDSDMNRMHNALKYMFSYLFFLFFLLLLFFECLKPVKMRLISETKSTSFVSIDIHQLRELHYFFSCVCEGKRFQFLNRYNVCTRVTQFETHQFGSPLKSWS